MRKKIQINNNYDRAKLVVPVTEGILLPYTRYEFRIMLDFGIPGLGQTFYYSGSSRAVRTAVGDKPGPPKILDIQQVNNLHIQIRWLPPTRPNGPIVWYRIQIQEIVKNDQGISEVRGKG